ncbi:hypothetical protein HVMH_0923 [Hydrogenovibrio marinus]|nr:hypothetical protein HVMH_0923 [Hydrogenovibrio marinus]
MKKIILILLGFSISYSSNLFASENVHICAKYHTQDGWSHGYSVNATFIDGSELNLKTSSFKYNSLYKYIVIFWKPNEASVIKMDFPFLTPVGVNGYDQNGRQWEVSNSNLCY